MKDFENFFTRFIFLAEKTHFSIVDISNKTGISSATIYRWRDGSKPNLKSVRIIARFFNVAERWLLTGEGEMNFDYSHINFNTENHNSLKFNERLERAIKQNRIKKGELAERLNVHQTLVSRWLSPTFKAERFLAEKISEVLGISPDWLLTGEGEMEAGAPRLAEETAVYGTNRTNRTDKANEANEGEVEKNSVEWAFQEIERHARTGHQEAKGNKEWQKAQIPVIRHWANYAAGKLGL